MFVSVQTAGLVRVNIDSRCHGPEVNAMDLTDTTRTPAELAPSDPAPVPAPLPAELARASDPQASLEYWYFCDDDAAMRRS